MVKLGLKEKIVNIVGSVTEEWPRLYLKERE